MRPSTVPNRARRQGERLKVNVELGRLIGLCFAASLAAVLSGSCATGADDPNAGVFGSKNDDAGNDSSAGSAGFGGTDGSGGQGGVGPGGTGGAFGQGGVGPGGTGPGGSGGEAGSAGTEGAGGSGGSSGTSGTGGTGAVSTCNPAFCPNNGMGTPCCTDPPDNRCGMNNGSGCQRTD
jgi:hypothetical protein